MLVPIKAILYVFLAHFILKKKTASKRLNLIGRTS